MDIDRYLQPEFDFSRLGPIEWELLGDITEDELLFVLRNSRTVWYDRNDYAPGAYRWHCFGFGSRSRCIELIVTIDQSNRIALIDANLTNEYGIEHYWCRMG
jgi:hypothetical protein